MTACHVAHQSVCVCIIIIIIFYKLEYACVSLLEQ